MQIGSLEQRIRDCFADVEPPPPWCLSSSFEGDETVSLRREFKDVPPWESLTPGFLNQTPNGCASALSFFSDEAFRYYLPAFLIADLHGVLEKVDPLFHLTHGLDQFKDEKINPRRYGERTFGDSARHRFSAFNQRQATAILEYLLHRAAQDEFDARLVHLAIDSYWADRVAEA